MYLHYILILVFYCAVVSSYSTPQGKPSLHVILYVNGKPVNIRGEDGIPNDNRNYEYIANDTLDFSCISNMTDKEGYYYNLVHEENGVNTTIPSEPNYYRRPVSDFNYTIIAEDFDAGSKIYCTVKKLDSATNIATHFAESAPLKLVMELGKSSNYTVPEVEYSDYVTINHTCNRSDDKGIHETKKITLTSSNTSWIYFCQMIHYKWNNTQTLEQRLVFSREIYNKIKYLHTLPYDSLPSSTRIGIGVGVAACVALVTSLTLLLLRYKTKKDKPVYPLYEEIELYASPNQLIYADLELSETALSANAVPQDRNDSPYAQIIGFMSRK